MAKITRRGFFGALTSGAVGLGMTSRGWAGSAGRNGFQSETPKIIKYNTLGKTGLRVSDVSCGAISFFEPNVLRYAHDLGVTYFDTAESYMRSRSESLLGDALSDIREQVILTTKHNYSRGEITKDGIITRMEESLKRMKTDRIDVALCHSVDDLKLLKNPELREAYAQLKKDGKVRFTGFSTHNAKLTLKQALDEDFVEVVLVIYNHLQGQEIEPLLKQVHDKGIGVVAMKVFAGGKQGNLKSMLNQQVSYPQAAIRWVLSSTHIDTCIPTMSSYSHVEEYVEASGKPLERADLGVIAEYRRQAGNQYCRVGCTECQAACPGNVAVNDVLRFAMYFDDYRMQKDAMHHYAELDASQKPLSCASCSGRSCETSCPHGLKVREKLIHAHEILSV